MHVRALASARYEYGRRVMSTFGRLCAVRYVPASWRGWGSYCNSSRANDPALCAHGLAVSETISDGRTQIRCETQWHRLRSERVSVLRPTPVPLSCLLRRPWAVAVLVLVPSGSALRRREPWQGSFAFRCANYLRHRGPKHSLQVATFSHLSPLWLAWLTFQNKRAIAGFGR